MIRSILIRVVSTSTISAADEKQLGGLCERIMRCENIGYDFHMWQQALGEYDLANFDELLLTNSSVCGPLSPLAALWDKPGLAECDFWGLTDNGYVNEHVHVSNHLQSYFLVFKRAVMQSASFARFWKSVLPYTNKYQLILSYEVGLTIWLEQNGFKWKALFAQEEIVSKYLKSRSLLKKVDGRIKGQRLPGRDTTIHFPDFLISSGMPFLKCSLLREANERIAPATAYAMLRDADLPKAALEELGSLYSLK